MELMDELLPTSDAQPAAEAGLEQWDTLLEGITYEEPPEAAPAGDGFFQKLLGGLSRKPAAQVDAGKKSQARKKARKKGPFARLKGWQKLILAVLGILMIVVNVALLTIILTTMQATPANGTPGGGNDLTGGVFTPTVEVTPTETPLPTATPTPTPTATPLPVATHLDSQITVNPNNVDLRLQRGRLYLDLGAYQAALNDFEHAVTIAPENAHAYTGIGQANFYLRDWDQAIIAYQSAIERNPSLPAAHFGMGTILYYQTRYEAAAAAFDRAAEIDPDYAEAEAWLAISAARAGDPVEALGAAQRAISVTQSSPLVFIARSWARRVQNPPDLDGAQSDLLHAQNQEPYTFYTLNALAEFYLVYRPERLGEAENLSQYAYNWAKSDLERAQALYTLGRIYLKQERIEDARRVLTQAADLTTVAGQLLLPNLAETLKTLPAP